VAILTSIYHSLSLEGSVWLWTEVAQEFSILRMSLCCTVYSCVAQIIQYNSVIRKGPLWKPIVHGYGLTDDRLSLYYTHCMPWYELRFY
jgi:hypothetical protein